MRKMYIAVFFVLFASSFVLGQLNQIANYNVFDVTGQPDTLRPYSSDKGARSVAYAGDIDSDGKVDFVATDYTNGGRVHWLELNNNKLEIVWSSQTRVGVSSGSTPRWVQVGDLDGDGNKEIIFPLTTTAADFAIHVYEYQGSDNDMGTEPAFILPADYFVGQTPPAPQGQTFRTNREVAKVYDFDGDGMDELIMTHRNNSVYILGVDGPFPGGFTSWQLEGGHPTQVPVNSYSWSASHWHSIPADLNGDGKIEIVNHHWNNWGFWSIIPAGTDSYRYPDTSVAKFYTEIFRDTPTGDQVSYMGIEAPDVDGDGNDEIAGILYGGSANNYALALIDMSPADTGLYIWEQSKGDIISRAGWTAGGVENGSFWGIASGDLNGNGRDEIFLGGTASYQIVAVEYKGSGSVLDSNSYTNTVIWGGAPTSWYQIDIYDSLGTVDSTFTESPFISKMVAGFDYNNNGKKDLVASYQSIYDSTTIRNFVWNTDSAKFVMTSSVKVNNLNKFNVYLFEYGATGIEVRELDIVNPEDYVLEQNYPNPFNPSTTVRFSLPVDKKISLKIYDVLGNLVSTLIDGQDFVSGSYEAVWNGKNNFGTSVASGMYIAELQFGNFSKTIKMQLLK